jgi:rhombotail lipoprotein
MSGRSTLVEAGEVVRKVKDESFTAAMEQMTGNLAVELDRFQERVKENPNVANTQWRPGSGGGAFGWLTLVLLALIGGRTRSG